ncbi:MAG TPA: hypothetical protein VD794_04205 [Flavisolibacter sp.]|nr:hypothetical protein [Flavisolibacter sp.]
MTGNKKKIVYILGGILIYIVSLYGAHLLWYDDDAQNGGGTLAAIITFIGSLVGLGMLFDAIVKKKNVAILMLFIAVLATIFLSDGYHKNLRRQKIQQEGQTTLAVVTYRDYVKRGKSAGGQEIGYTYYINDKVYKKYATNESYIVANNIQPNDTLIVTYWAKNPNYHEYTIKKAAANTSFPK